MEACSLLLHIAFVEYDLQRLELSIATENTASLAVARKLGFIPEGVQRQSERIADRYYDHQLLGLLRSEYSDGSCGNQIHRKWDDSEAGKVYY
jgi:ribosomal-protein-serine acetyltransferase